MTAFDKAWDVVKADGDNSDHDEPDDSPYAGTTRCPCRQGYNPCDDSKCAEWHKGNSRMKKSGIVKEECCGRFCDVPDSPLCTCPPDVKAANKKKYSEA